jgi:hypothetical protein
MRERNASGWCHKYESVYTACQCPVPAGCSTFSLVPPACHHMTATVQARFLAPCPKPSTHTATRFRGINHTPTRSARLPTPSHALHTLPHSPHLPHHTQLAYVSSPRGPSLSTHNPLQAPPPRRRVQRKRTREKTERGSFHTPRVREWNGRGQICKRVGAAVQREFATNVQTDRAERKAVCEGGREFASGTRVVGESGEGVAHPSHCRRGASQSDASRRWPR